MHRSILLICGKLFDGINDHLFENYEILIADGLIVDIGRNLSRPRNVEIIDLQHLTITPGLIDAHVHSNLLCYQETENILNKSNSYSALASLHTAERCLARGFTTIRSFGMGPRDYGLVDLKKLIARGFFAASRLIVSAQMLGTPGMPGDMSLYLADNPFLSGKAEIPSIGSGSDFFRDRVRKEIKYGSDLVKIFYSGSFGSPDGGPELCYLDNQELDAIIKTAHALKKPVTAHAYMPNHVKTLLDYGIDCIEHAALIDEETAAYFGKTTTFLVPTFSPYQDIIEGNKEEIKTASAGEQLKKALWQDKLIKSRRIICDSEIVLGFGSDFCAQHHAYESWYEYRAWLLSGMDPFRTLKAASSINARICGIDKLTGSIETGKAADIAGWASDLLNDPEALQICSFVMKEGRIYPTDDFVSSDNLCGKYWQ